MTTLDLESNVLYRALLDNFRQQFDVACRGCYVIALPVNEALQDVIIDQNLVNSHILMPSKLLRMHYTPLQVGYSADDIEIDGRRLIIHNTTRQQQAAGHHHHHQQAADSAKHSSKQVIKILAEDIGYNSENKQYKLLLIDRPLVSTINRTKTTQTSTSMAVRQRNVLMKSLGLVLTRKERVRCREAPENLFDHNDCSHYLESISQQLTVELERQVQRIQSKYIILSHYLNDAAERIKQLTETFIPKYIQSIEQLSEKSSSSSSSSQEKIIDSIRISVENYVIHLLHGKLIASIYHRYERNDDNFKRKLNLIKQSQLSVCQLGAQEAFDGLEIDDKIKNNLLGVSSLQSPLAMVNRIVQIVDGISSNLDDCVRARNQLMNFDSEFETISGQASRGTVSICSDDLIASLIYVLVQVQPDRIYSMSKYLDLFNWSARDRAAYYTATFHVVVQYIYNYKVDLADQESSTSSNSSSSSLRSDTDSPSSGQSVSAAAV